MPVKQVEHIPLAKCRVLYLGSAVPIETAVGLEAVQKPLAERYPVDGESDVSGIDAWLTVLSSGVHMQYVADPSTIVWFPIQTLQVCTAVKCVVMVNGSTGEKTGKFISLDSPASSSTHPPIFAAIMRRTKGIKVLECHSFICKSNTAAMALVQSCRHAYQHEEGWVEGAPPAEVLQGEMEDTPVGSMRGSVNDSVHMIPADAFNRENVAPEFLEAPPPQGVFYTNNKKLVRNFNVFGRGARSPPNMPPRPGVPPPHLMGPGRYPMPMYPPRGPFPPRMMYPPRGPPFMAGPPPRGMPPPHFRPPMMMMPPPGDEAIVYGPGHLPPGFPASYFEDWEAHEGSPVADFWNYDEEMGGTTPRGSHHERDSHRDHRRQSGRSDSDERHQRRHKSVERRHKSVERRHKSVERRHKSQDRRHHSPERRRSHSRERRHLPKQSSSPRRRPTRHQSPSPERRPQRQHEDLSYESSSSGEMPKHHYRKHRESRPKTPPADYQKRERNNGYQSPERMSRREQFELVQPIDGHRRRFPSAYDRRDEPDYFENGTVERNQYETQHFGDHHIRRSHRAKSQPPMYSDESPPTRKKSSNKKDKSKKNKKHRDKNKKVSSGDDAGDTSGYYSPDAFIRRGTPQRGNAGPWMDYHEGQEFRENVPPRNGVDQRPFPNRDEGFENSNRRERSMFDDFRYTDPYELNNFRNENRPRDRDDDSQLDYSMFDKPHKNLERTLGYLP